MIDQSFFFFFLFFFSNSLSTISIIQFIIDFITFSLYFSFKITSFYIKTIYYPLKLIKYFFELIPILPILFQTLIIFHFCFDLIWSIYLHLVINCLFFFCLPYYTYLIFGVRKQEDKSIIFLIQKSTKYVLKIVILIFVVYYSHFNNWFENAIMLILNEIILNHRVTRK